MHVESPGDAEPHCECHRQGVPITNYGLVIAYSLGILERALEPFPEALAAYKEARQEQLEARRGQ